MIETNVDEHKPDYEFKLGGGYSLIRFGVHGDWFANIHDEPIESSGELCQAISSYAKNILYHAETIGETIQAGQDICSCIKKFLDNARHCMWNGLVVFSDADMNLLTEDIVGRMKTYKTLKRYKEMTGNGE